MSHAEDLGNFPRLVRAGAELASELPMRFSRPRWFALALLTMLGSCADPEECNPIDPELHPSTPDPPLVSGTVVDARGNEVTIDSVKARHKQGITECSAELGYYSCLSVPEGPVEIEIVAAGQTMTGELDVDVPPAGCYPHDDPLNFTLPGAGCPPADGIAVRGTVTDGTGSPVVLRDAAIAFAMKPSYPYSSSNVFYRNQATACTFQGSSFECPALTPYNAPYTVGVSVGDHLGYVVQRVDVASQACEVMPESIVIDIREADNF